MKFDSLKNANQKNDNSGQIKEISTRDIAIIGISARFPQADHFEEFWTNIKNGMDCITDFPEPRRKDTDLFLRVSGQKTPETQYSKGAFLDDIDKFDYPFFRLSPKEASLMDPNQRLFLETVWKTIEDAGYGGKRLAGTRTGVYLGFEADAPNNYKRFIENLDPESVSQAVTGNLTSIIAGRISYLLDLKGPSISVDTACSSALVAIHLACQAIRNGECELAIAGSVRTNLLPVKGQLNFGIDSSDSKTRAFDDSSDGTGSGEGVAAVLLKPLNSARKDHDQIYAVIKGSFSNQDGNSIGITAPNVLAQEDVIINTWKSAGVDPETISYIEAHGTGTKLGDPIEIDGIGRAFRKYTDKKQFCAIGTVKTNIGHLDNAAGMAGLLKAVSALKNKQLPPTLHFQKPNRQINFEQSPVYINDQLRDWESSGSPRRCGVSSFGFSGTNCHLILDEAPEVYEELDPEDNKPYIFTVSAKDQEALQQLAAAYQKFFTRPILPAPRDICYTASTGRAHYPYRLALIVHGREDFKRQIGNLHLFSINPGKSDPVYFGVHHLIPDQKGKKEAGEVTEKEIKELSRQANVIIKEIGAGQDRNILLCKLGELYVRGAEIDWQELYWNEPGNKVSLPTYPFARKRCWVEPAARILNQASAEGSLFSDKIPLPAKLAPQDGFFPGQSHLTSEEIELHGKNAGDYTTVEKSLARIWSEVLGYRSFDIHTNLYELGGDSLSMVNIAAKIQTEFGIKLTLGSLSQAGTIAEMAAFIANSEAPTGMTPVQGSAVISNESDLHEPFPLTNLQMAYLLGREPGIELGGISTHVYFEIKTKLELERLNRSLNQVIERHPMMRAIISPSGAQRFLSEIPAYHIDVVDASRWNRQEQTAAIIRERERMSHDVFKPGEWPLFEIKAVKLEDNLHHLLFGIDVLIADGFSLQLIFKEWMEYYRNPALNLPMLNFTFRDYIIAWNELTKSDSYLESQHFWLTRMADIFPAPSLPLKKDPAKIAKPYFVRKSKTIERTGWHYLKTLCQKHNVTPSALLGAIYAQVLAFFCNQPQLTINLPIFNRYPFHPDVNQIIGDFTSLILLSLDLKPGSSLWEKAGQVQAGLLEGLEQRLYDGIELIREISHRNNLGTRVAMPVVFTSMLFGAEYDLGAFWDENNEIVMAITQTPQVYLDYQVTERNGALIIQWDYVEELFEPELITAMYEQYLMILNGLISGEEGQVRECRLSEADRKLIGDYNQTAQFFLPTTLQRLFTEQVRCVPEKQAVVFEDQSISYRELHEKSNQVAYFLKTRGVGQNDFVGLMANRKIYTIVNVLGALKVGAAYVPVEPDFPEERRNYIFRNSGCKIILDTNDYFTQGMAQCPSQDLPEVFNPEDIAYVIYTSGSAGAPKGVVITQRAAVNTIIDINLRYRVNRTDRIIGLSSMCFDLSVYDIFGALSSGATLVQISDVKVPQQIIHTLIHEKITIWNSVPAIMEMVVDGLIHQDFDLPETTGDSDISRTTLAEIAGASSLPGRQGCEPGSFPERYRKLKREQLNQGSARFGAFKVDIGAPRGLGFMNRNPKIIDFEPAQALPFEPFSEFLAQLGEYVLHNDLKYYHTSDGASYPVEIFIAIKEGKIDGLSGGLYYYHPFDQALYLIHNEPFPVEDAYLGADKSLVHSAGFSIYLMLNQELLTGRPEQSGYLQATIDSGILTKILVRSAALLQITLYPVENLDFNQLKPYFNQDQKYELIGVMVGGLKSRPSNLKALYPATKFDRSGASGERVTDHHSPSVLPDRAHHLRLVLLSGDWIPLPLPGKIKRCFHDLEIISLGGATEASIWSIYYPIGEVQPHWKSIPYGYPLANQTFYVLNHELAQCPVEVPGELYIGGLGLAKGYLNDFEKTANAFISHRTFGTLYKTGDYGVFHRAGYIEFLGRKDFQVKIRGYRIELGEIESKLLRHEAVEEALVDARKDPAGNSYLCAYIIAQKEIPVQELRKHLAEQLPDYMIPSYFVKLAKLPLTPNGKIDRRNLPDPEVNIHTGVEFEAPRNGIEAKVAEIWREVLGIERVGIHENFFELGGHSLKATLLVAKIHKALNREFPLREVFQKQNIKEQAEYLAQASENLYETIRAINECEGYPAGCYPLSSAQKRLYVLNQFEPNQTNYNTPGVTRIQGELDQKRLESVFQTLIQRHETLRTSIEVIAGEPVQRVHGTVEFSIGYQEIAGKETGEIVREFILPFDLKQAPLFRVKLVKTGIHEYLLMYDIHHIVSDGVSMGILFREFIELYEGKDLPALRIQYKDYASWQKAMNMGIQAVAGQNPNFHAEAWPNESLQNNVIKKQEEYWLKTFSGEIPVLNLPLDYPRPVVQSFAGDRIGFEVGAAITQGLGEIAKETGATVYMILLAAFNILLAKYSGQEDIIVGSPTAGRPHVDLEQIIGMFVNTLAFINHPAGAKTFKGFLTEVKENALKAYENQDYQFEELVEKLNLNRGLSRNPLFDVVFVLQNMDLGSSAMKDLKLSPIQIENQTSKFDLTLQAIESKDSISFSLEYCTKLFKPETIERMAGHLQNILRTIVSNREIQLAEIEMISEAEKRQILYEFNDTQAEYPSEKTIQRLFEEQVERTPDQIAVVYEEKTLTYRELNTKANQLARVLREKGTKAGAIVAIMAERSLAMIIGMIAIVKSGGAYLPINPHYPEERIKYMLEDSQTTILLTQPEFGARQFSGERLYLDNADLYQGAISDLSPVNTPGDLIYVIYTSGTTGNPKGAMIEHRNVVRLLFNDRNKFDFNSSDIWTMFHSFCFDFSVWEMYGALLYGGKLIIIPQMIAQDPKEYLKLLKREGVTVLNQTPTMFYNIVTEELKDLRRDLKIRWIIFGGEALQPIMLQPWHDKYPDTKLINMYGITETTVHVTYKELAKQEIESNISNIGNPIPTLTTYVMNQNMKITPLGVAGELAVGGEGVGRGYLNRPELTAKKFVPNPYQPGERLYLSGDLARRLGHGDLEYLGRIDHQVKIRGFRVELGEIEACLCKYEAIHEVAVIAKEDESSAAPSGSSSSGRGAASGGGAKYLCAYVVGERELTPGELREYVSQTLPEYMVPAYFVQLEKLPVTSNGKVDRRKLPEPEGNIRTGVEYAAPRNEIEAELVELWQEILNIPRIGIDDDLFELGAHSLKAAAFVSKVQQRMKVDIPLKEVFMTPTVRELGAYIQKATPKRYEAIMPVPAREYYPASWFQKGMYVINQFGNMGTNFHISGASVIEGQLDRERLENVFQKIIHRHEALRTSFELLKGEEVIQRIHPDSEFAIEWLEAPEEEVPGIVQAFIRPFDLSRAPLLRIGLARTSQFKNVLIYDMHHIIADGVSMDILVDEFIRLYEGKELPQLKLQYRDYAAWHNELYYSGEMKKQEEYWLKIFRGPVPRLNLPTDFPRPDTQSLEASTIHFDIDPDLIAKLKEIAVSHRTTLYMVLLAVFNILLFKYTGQEDIIIGTQVANRPTTDLEKVIGMFVNMLALRNYPQGEKTFRDFLIEIKDTALDAFANQDYPFEALIEKLQSDRTANQGVLFDVEYSYVHSGAQATQSRELRITPYPNRRLTVTCDLFLNVFESDSLHFCFHYSTVLFKEETIMNLIQHFIEIIKSISVDSLIKIKEITIVEQSAQKLIQEKLKQNANDINNLEGVDFGEIL